LVGKLEFKLLERYVLSRLGARDAAVRLGPGVGVDAAVIQLPDGRYLVVHSDPITEAASRIGWLAVNVAANDVAVAGARPRWASITILLPEGFTEDLLDQVTREIDEAARKLGISVVGGHTEEAPRLDRPIVIATVMGLADRLIGPHLIRPGDVVIIAKNVGGEGASIIVNDFPHLVKELPDEVRKAAARLADDISVVREALEIADLVHAMHDPTEGGVLGALYELAYASKTVIEVDADRIPIPEPVRAVTRAARIDPLKLISSGALIAVAAPDHAEEVVSRLRRLGVVAETVGYVKERGTPLVVVKRGSRVERVEGFVVDEIARLWQEQAR
jgi:hydrogenase expression/formation protein HypE